jgi:superfamily II DNA or RNA helicase
MILRPYQERMIADVRNSLRSHRRVVLQSPTGSGKTAIASAIVKMATEKSSRVLFLAPRRELVIQTNSTLKRFGVSSGIIMAGMPPTLYASVQVASFDTLHARAIQRSKIQLPKAELVVVDEAHLSIAQSRKDILELYPDARIIGLTATPARGDGKGLGEFYEDLVLGESISSLTAQGYLVPLRYYIPTKPDLSALKVRGGDYVESELGGVMDKPQLVGDIIKHWKRLASDRSTVVFCSGIAHSKHVTEEFLKHGITAEHLDGETPAEERKGILARVESGETQVLCNVFVASYGLDIPRLSCAVLARPTKNITLYLQTVGRIMRTFPDKVDGIVIDHAGAVDENGFADDDIPWSLDIKETVKERKEKAQAEKKEPKQITCPACSTAFSGRRVCPACGMEVIAQNKPIPYHEADLVEAVRPEKFSQEYKEEFFAGLRGYAQLHGKKQGWAWYVYQDKFQVRPPTGMNPAPIAPSADVLGFITHRNIKRAKGVDKAASV